MNHQKNMMFWSTSTFSMYVVVSTIGGRGGLVIPSMSLKGRNDSWSSSEVSWQQGPWEEEMEPDPFLEVHWQRTLGEEMGPDSLLRSPGTLEEEVVPSPLLRSIVLRALRRRGRGERERERRRGGEREREAERKRRKGNEGRKKKKWKW
jgi:hypothetical protein